MVAGLRIIVPLDRMEEAIALTYMYGAQGVQWVEEADGGPEPGTVWIHVWHESDSLQERMEAYLRRLGTESNVHRLDPIASASSEDTPRYFPLTERYHVRCILGDEEDFGAMESSEIKSQPITLKWGSGFGLGDHATTRLCAQALEWALSQTRQPQVADIGTGTGVLGILAALNGAKVLATDIEDIARQAALENAERNQVSDRFSVVAAVPDNTHHHIAVANLYLGPVMNLATELSHWMHPKGWGILSGFGEKESQMVCSTYAAQGWQYVRRYTEDGWVALVMQWADPSPV